MTETTLRVDGMMCSMCEAHVNDAIRRSFAVKKVSSLHTKGVTVVLSDQPLDERTLREAVEAAGYRVLSVSSRQAEKRGLLGFLRK